MESYKDKIFAVTCTGTLQHSQSNTFFFSKKGAKEHLQELAKERKHKFGVTCWEETDDSFSFVIGWEEVKVKFSIVELPCYP